MYAKAACRFGLPPMFPAGGVTCAVAVFLRTVRNTPGVSVHPCPPTPFQWPTQLATAPATIGDALDVPANVSV